MTKQSNKLDFSGQNIYAGFDVHKKNWRVTIMSDELTLKTFTQDPKPLLLFQHLKSNYPGATYHTAYEAGFCGYWIHNQLKELGVNSIVVNPADIPTTHKEKVQKEDARDSRKIAKSLRSGDLRPIHVPSLITLEDRAMVRMRATLVKDMTRNKNRVKCFLHFHGIELAACFEKSGSHWSNRFFEWLSQIEMSESSGKETLEMLVNTTKQLRASVAQITKQIRLMSKNNVYVENVKLLRSIPGIGFITAMTIITEVETITRFRNNDHFCSFIGLIPSTHSSGDHDGVGDITSRGNKILRSAIVESAWIAARLDPTLVRSYHLYCQRMEPNNAIIRIAKKLANRIIFVLKNKKPYEYSINKN